ncbi:hypothetical protein B4Q13_22365 [Lacticaseibacillus rhamnosus]
MNGKADHTRGIRRGVVVDRHGGSSATAAPTRARLADVAFSRVSGAAAPKQQACCMSTLADCVTIERRFLDWMWV